MLVAIMVFFQNDVVAGVACVHTDGLTKNTMDCNCGAQFCSDAQNSFGQRTGRYCTLPANGCDAANSLIPPLYKGWRACGRCDEVPRCPGGGSNLTKPGIHNVAYPGCHVTIPGGVEIQNLTHVEIVGIANLSNNGALPVLSGGHKNRIFKVVGSLTLRCRCNRRMTR